MEVTERKRKINLVLVFLVSSSVINHVTGEKIVTKLDPQCFGKPEGYKYTNPANCAEFFHCTHGQSVIHRCPASTFFSQKDQQCDYPENVECRGIPAEPDCAASDHGEIFPNPNDCTTFYICSHGKAYLIHCDPMLSFDREVKNCNWADLVICPDAARKENWPKF